MLLYSEKLLSFNNSWTNKLLRVFMTRLPKLRLAVKGCKIYLPNKSTYDFLGILLGLKSRLIRHNLSFNTLLHWKKHIES